MAWLPFQKLQEYYSVPLFAQKTKKFFKWKNVNFIQNKTCSKTGNK